MEKRDKNTIFTAASLCVGDYCILSQRESGIVEFFGGSDKGFPYSDDQSFYNEISWIFFNKDIDSNFETEYLNSLPNDPIKRQIIHRILIEENLVVDVNSLKELHHQEYKGISQHYFIVESADYINSDGGLIAFEPKNISKLDIQFKPDEIRNPYFSVHLPTIKSNEYFKLKMQNSHRTAFNELLKLKKSSFLF